MKRKKYVQYNMLDFCREFPHLRMYIPIDIQLDSRYVVRVSTVTGAIEFGFPSDYWHIK